MFLYVCICSLVESGLQASQDRPNFSTKYPLKSPEIARDLPAQLIAHT